MESHVDPAQTPTAEDENDDEDEAASRGPFPHPAPRTPHPVDRDRQHPPLGPPMTTKPTLSVCVITWNEEANIRACLESVQWADERIVIDSNSTDRTADIARGMGAKVVLRPFEGHVQQKNFALDQATSDWVLSIDADERVTPDLADEIRAVVAGDRPEVAFSMPRKSWYLGRWILHGGWYPDRKLRLTRRGKARWSGTNPHDHLYADGPTAELRGDLVHYTYRDISDHLRKIDQYTSIAAREMAARGVGHPLLRMALHSPLRILRMYVFKAGFLDGQAGFVLAVLSGYYVFLKYAKLWELARRANAGGGGEAH